MFGRATDKISSVTRLPIRRRRAKAASANKCLEIFSFSHLGSSSSERRNGDILLLRRLIATLLPGTVLRAHSRALPLKLLDPVDTLEKYRARLLGNLIARIYENSLDDY